MIAGWSQWSPKQMPELENLPDDLVRRFSVAGAKATVKLNSTLKAAPSKRINRAAGRSKKPIYYH